MTDYISFGSNLQPAGTVPTFVGNGSKVEHPDLQVVFWGPYWPGSGPINQGSLMQAINTLVNSPFMDGLQQYGYIGPVNVRQPMVISSAPGINYPTLAPGVQQQPAVDNAVFNLVDNLIGNDNIPNVDDNHDLIVMVVLDPSIPYPQNEAANGNISTVFGDHSKYERFEFLDDNTRFAYGWVGTNAAQGLAAFDEVTKTFSHELAESITNPFVGSGWVQNAPPAPAGSGEIGDVCSVYARVDGITVTSYWSIAQQACVIPTEHRNVYLGQQLTKHIPHDSPTQTAYVNLGPLCGSGNFDYVERTWENEVVVTVSHPGYQIPVFTWSINGKALPAGVSTLEVPCTWETASSGLFGKVAKLPIGLKAEAHVGVGVGKLPAAPIPPTPLAIPLAGGRPSTATLRITVFGPTLVIGCGPNQGNTQFTVGCQVIENWDNAPGTQVTTQKTASTFVDLQDQQIIWGEAYQQAAENCYKRTHMVDGPQQGPRLPGNPGDPGPGGTTINPGTVIRGKSGG